MKRAFAVLLLLFVVVSVASAQQKNAGVSVVALKVGRDIPEDKEGNLTFFQKGVVLTLVVRNAEKQFIGMDDKSKATSFTDEKGTDLLKKEGWGMVGISSFPKFSADGHLCVVDVSGPTPPAQGTKTLRLKGTLALTCGANEKTVVQKGLKLEKGAKLTVGPVPWTIEKAGKPDWGDAEFAVEVTGTVAHDAIKEIVFLDAGGKVVEHEIGMRSSGGMLGRMTYGVTYNLKKKVDVVDVKVTYYDKLETLTIPLDLEIGAGM